jgi:hypothetical protein
MKISFLTCCDANLRTGLYNIVFRLIGLLLPRHCVSSCCELRGQNSYMKGGYGNIEYAVTVTRQRAIVQLSALLSG